MNLYILKVGTTFEDTARRHGDFDLWTTRAVHGAGDIHPVQVLPRDADPPAPATAAGVVITGSHAMVTDEEPWSKRLEKWLPSVVDAGVPVLGICYGHHLLARALGGVVADHPHGPEVGTVEIETTDAAQDDALFGAVPGRFLAQVTHTQSVRTLPPGAVHLAANAYERHQAFRMGDAAWGVQFHPEFSAAVMREYITAERHVLKQRGKHPSDLHRSVRETPTATGVARAFGRLVARRR